MKSISTMRIRWKGLIDTMIRFPLTIVLLAAAVITNAVIINTQNNRQGIKLLLTFLLGASICTVGQLLYESFFRSSLRRLLIMGAAAAFSVSYYFSIYKTDMGIEVSIRTTVIFFILLIAFLWIPAVKSRINFNQSFMAAFKSFFVASFFTGILFLGTALIIGAINLLIIKVNGNSYEHAANIIFTFLAPFYFLSMIPVYPNRNEEKAAEKALIDSEEKQQDELISDNIIVPGEAAGREELLMKAISPARFLKTLISYIIIPVTAVFTIILLLYIILNISGDFWTNNLLEPLLLSYSITVIIVYLLTSNLQSVFAGYFRKIFPKVLVPVVLFQTIASIIKISEVGITYGRYFIILFGVFAIAAGIVFCVLPVQKNGVIAPILIILSLISVIPPVDAFTVSRINQTVRLENVLKRNDMLKNDTVTPKKDISEKDQNIIISSVNYLNSIDDTKKIAWLSAYHKSGNFETSFGFPEYAVNKNEYTNIYIERDSSTPIPVSGYDYVIFRNINNNSLDFQTADFKAGGKKYSLKRIGTATEAPHISLSEAGKEIISFDTSEMFNKYTTGNKTMAATEDVTFKTENASAVMAVIAQSINVNKSEYERNLNADVFILIHIK